MKIQREFFKRDALEVAKDLLGKNLIVETDEGAMKVRLVEVEAYTGEEDKACHTYGGRRTARTEVMYKEGGHLYVYLIYGMYNMLNIVTGRQDDGQAVLIRAGEPLEGLDLMAKNRFDKTYKDLSSYQKKNLTNGPGKLAQALGLDRSHNGIDILGEKIYLEDDDYSDFEIEKSKRIGIDYAEEARDYLYRFYIKGSKFLSVKI
ncbi:DNA-3-methyladenine glycosylase [Neofamilia massiliensis]|uniref:DNA-3-methyladenine glycosylase n=1 Tax=Neofamilia massiliensis TaxID=1673724 RepID=UPI0006BB6A68|nr:DNA-3-methyladenine glycosylase [Neofamilia massiliensis]